MHQFKLVDEIGKGPYSTVYKGRKRNSVNYCTITSFEKCRLKRVQNRTQTLRYLEHSNIIQFYNWYETAHHLWVITEYCTGGDLRSILTRECKLSRASVATYAADIAVGLLYMHSRSILCNDLRPCNLLLSSTCTIRFYDFSLACNFTSAAEHEPIGSPPYMAPELFAVGKGAVSMASDLWSFGCVLYEMASGRPPFQGANLQELIINILLRPAPRIPHASSALNNLLQSLLVKDPIKRARWEEVVSSSLWENALKLPAKGFAPETAFDEYKKNYGGRWWSALEMRDIATRCVKVAGHNSDTSISRSMDGQQGGGDIYQECNFSVTAEMIVSMTRDEPNSTTPGIKSDLSCFAKSDISALDGESTAVINSPKTINTVVTTEEQVITTTVVFNHTTTAAIASADDSYSDLSSGGITCDESPSKKDVKPASNGPGNTGGRLTGHATNIDNNNIHNGNSYKNDINNDNSAKNNKASHNNDTNLPSKPSQNSGEHAEQQNKKDIDIILSQKNRQAALDATPTSTLVPTKKDVSKTALPPTNLNSRADNGNNTVVSRNNNDNNVSAKLEGTTTQINSSNAAYAHDASTNSNSNAATTNTIYHNKDVIKSIPVSTAPPRAAGSNDNARKSGAFPTKNSVLAVGGTDSGGGASVIAPVVGVPSKKDDILLLLGEKSPTLEPFGERNACLDELLWHSSDAHIRPLCMNAHIERFTKPTYNAHLLDFPAHTLEQVKMFTREECNSYIAKIYRRLASSSTSNETKLSILNFFQTICADTSTANVLANSSFLILCIKLAGQHAASENFRTTAVTTLCLLVRYTTYIDTDMVKPGILQSLCSLYSNEMSVKVQRRVLACIGELLFYIVTQPEKEREEWACGRVGDLHSVFNDALGSNDEALRHYAAKGIENVASVANKALVRKVFCTPTIVQNLLNIFDNNTVLSMNDQLRACALCAAVKLAIARSSLIPQLMQFITERESMCASVLEKFTVARTSQIFLTFLNYALFQALTTEYRSAYTTDATTTTTTTTTVLTAENSYARLLLAPRVDTAINDRCQCDTHCTARANSSAMSDADASIMSSRRANVVLDSNCSPNKDHDSHHGPIGAIITNHNTNGSWNTGTTVSSVLPLIGSSALPHKAPMQLNATAISSLPPNSTDTVAMCRESMTLDEARQVRGLVLNLSLTVLDTLRSSNDRASTAMQGKAMLFMVLVGCADPDVFARLCTSRHIGFLDRSMRDGDGYVGRCRVTLANFISYFLRRKLYAISQRVASSSTTTLILSAVQQLLMAGTLRSAMTLDAEFFHALADCLSKSISSTMYSAYEDDFNALTECVVRSPETVQRYRDAICATLIKPYCILLQRRESQRRFLAVRFLLSIVSALAADRQDVAGETAMCTAVLGKTTGEDIICATVGSTGSGTYSKKQDVSDSSSGGCHERGATDATAVCAVARQQTEKGGNDSAVSGTVVSQALTMIVSAAIKVLPDLLAESDPVPSHAMKLLDTCVAWMPDMLHAHMSNDLVATMLTWIAKCKECTDFCPIGLIATALQIGSSHNTSDTAKTNALVLYVAEQHVALLFRILSNAFARGVDHVIESTCCILDHVLRRAVTLNSTSRLAEQLRMCCTSHYMESVMLPLCASGAVCASHAASAVNSLAHLNVAAQNSLYAPVGARTVVKVLTNTPRSAIQGTVAGSLLSALTYALEQKCRSDKAQLLAHALVQKSELVTALRAVFDASWPDTVTTTATHLLHQINVQ